MKTKQRMRLEIKEITAEGTFEGLLSPYNVVDQGKDIIEPGAYTKTLKDKGDTRPLLWQHRAAEPIGEIKLDDRADGLWCKGSLLMALPEAQKAYLLIKAGIVKGLSIGFETVKDSVEAGVRHLKEIILWEGSVVTFPMAETALITSVKHSAKENKGDFSEELLEIQLCDARYQMLGALSSALSSLFWSGLTKDDIVTSTEVILQQFSDAYMAYVPAYVDMLTERYGDLEIWSKEHRETKEGRAISMANKTTLKAALDHAASIQTIISALVDDLAGDDGTSKEAAASTTQPEQAAETKSKPAYDHLAISSLLTNLKENFNGAH